tara:strand:- start:51 stop:437 length:387 start_codon:yes stop_codon:yes gene_type:complete
VTLEIRNLGIGALGKKFDAYLKRQFMTEFNNINSLVDHRIWPTNKTLPATLPEIQFHGPWTTDRGYWSRCLRLGSWSWDPIFLIAVLPKLTYYFAKSGRVCSRINFFEGSSYATPRLNLRGHLGSLKT